MLAVFAEELTGKLGRIQEVLETPSRIENVVSSRCYELILNKFQTFRLDFSRGMQGCWQKIFQGGGRQQKKERKLAKNIEK